MWNRPPKRDSDGWGCLQIVDRDPNWGRRAGIPHGRPAARRLYLSHATKVVVVDIDANKVVGEIAELPGVHAFVAVPELQRGFSSNGKENTLVY